MRKLKVLKYYFFIGTEAELIKLLPVIKEFQKRNIPFYIIASGQNNIEKSEILKYLAIKNVDLVLAKGQIKQTAFGVLSWFFSTLIRSIFLLRKLFTSDKVNKVMIVHGDTVSTVMGAILAKIYGMKLVHIEAGLRSFNLLNPFPEEIDRLIVSYLSSIHFCPNEWAYNNLKNRNGEKVVTKQNTLYESSQIALSKKNETDIVERLKVKKYAVFILHRQENIYNTNILLEFLDALKKTAEKITCVFVIHEPTKQVLISRNLYESIHNNQKIILISRMSYFDFTKLLFHSEFIVTDGGSNQEEMYYFGKPCLIVRKVTERIEGLGKNVVLSKGNMGQIAYFVENYKRYKQNPIRDNTNPSKIIVDYLVKLN